jgi:hypothetical protein
VLREELMAKSNITLKIDSQLLRKVKVLAAKQETSISALLVSLLEERVSRDIEYDQAKERALARMREGFDLGGRPFSRDELYDR